MPVKNAIVVVFGVLLESAVVFGQSSPLPGAIQPGSIHIGLQQIASGLVAPVTAISAPGDTSDLFVVDQGGKIDVIHNGVMQATPLLNLSALESAVPLSPQYDERGLLGLVFSPGFNDPNSLGFHKLYTYQSEATGTATANFAPAAGTLTSGINHQNVLTEWTVSSTNPNVVDTSTRRDLLREDHPALNHNGGTIAFWPRWLSLPRNWRRWHRQRRRQRPSPKRKRPRPQCDHGQDASHRSEHAHRQSAIWNPRG